eukprot:6189109-Pleurochrysis_carterae.AAC.4
MCTRGFNCESPHVLRVFLRVFPSASSDNSRGVPRKALSEMSRVLKGRGGWTWGMSTKAHSERWACCDSSVATVLPIRPPFPLLQAE